MLKSIRKCIVRIPLLIIQCDAFQEIPERGYFQNDVRAGQTATFSGDESFHAKEMFRIDE